MKSNVVGPGGPTASQEADASIVTATADSLPDQPHRAGPRPCVRRAPDRH